MPTIDVDGLAIFYLEYGEANQPPLILLHGLYGDSSTMTTLARRLADRFRVIAPDALGHGRSARPDGFTLEDQGRMLNGLIAALGYPNATVLGVSMGSYLAAQTAILEPARTSHLVLVVGKAHGTTSSSAAYAQRMGVDLSTATPEQLMALMESAIWSPDTPASRKQAILAAQSDQVQLTQQEREAVERSLAGFDLRPNLPVISAPTLVISGKADGLNPPEFGQKLAELIPSARFEVYEHSGHALTFEEEDRLVADVAEFVLG